MPGCPSSLSWGWGGAGVRKGREGFSPYCSKPSERSPSPEKTKNRHYKCLARRKNSISFSDKCFPFLECGPWSYHGSMGEAFLGGSGQYALEFGDVHRPWGHCWIPVGRALKTEKREPLWHWGQGRKHGRSACPGNKRPWGKLWAGFREGILREEPHHWLYQGMMLSQHTCWGPQGREKQPASECLPYAKAGRGQIES